MLSPVFPGIGISTLSDKILASIFTHWFSDYKYSLVEITCAELTGALTGVRLVSKRWNKIVLSTPELWSLIILDLDCCFGDPPLLSLDHLKTWAQRSGSVPLRLFIWQDADPPGEEDAVILKEMLQILWSNIHRVEFLWMRGLLPSSMDTISKLGFTDAAHLTYLNFQRLEAGDSDSIGHFIKALGDIRSLEEFHFMNLDHNAAVNISKFMSLHSLRTLCLHIEEKEFKSAIDTIRRCPHLKSLRLETLEGEEWGELEEEYEPIFLPDLLHLHVGLIPNQFKNILRLLDCPRLESWIVCLNRLSEISNSEVVGPTLVEFMDRHRLVEELKILDLPKDEIVPLFKTNIFQAHSLIRFGVHIHQPLGDLICGVEVSDIMQRGGVEVHDDWHFEHFVDGPRITWDMYWTPETSGDEGEHLEQCSDFDDAYNLNF